MRRLISNGYLSLERSEAAAVAIALEAWIGTEQDQWATSQQRGRQT